MFLTTVKLALSKSTRILVYVLLGILFNIGEQTDEFFLAYSLATFVVTVVTVSESYLLKYTSQMLGAFILILTPIVIVLATAIFFIGNSPLVYMLLPYIILATLASVLTGTVNSKKQYTITLYSSIAYILILPIVFTAKLLETEYILEVIILLITLPELIRLVLLIKLSTSPLNTLTKIEFPSKVMLLLIAAPILVTISVVLERIVITTTLPIGSITIWSYIFGLVGVIGGVVNYGRIVHYTNEDDENISIVPSLKLGLIMILVLIIPVGIVSQLPPIEINFTLVSLSLHVSAANILVLLFIASLSLPIRYTIARLVVVLIKYEKTKTLILASITLLIAKLLLVGILSLISIEAAAVGVVCSELVYLIIVYISVKRTFLSPQSSYSY
ncbi:hypothetical protein LCGC14_0422160 [marine sediment metagenome]|uniref:Uncharacterized protein n=1 Tax=marine sediment metagenome TaxID=412755 RepID=A0A0F9VCM5_9ZZZZ